MSRVRAGKHLGVAGVNYPGLSRPRQLSPTIGGGDVTLASLQRDVDLLLHLRLRLIEPAGTCPYRLTQLGARVLDAMKSAAGSAPS